MKIKLKLTTDTDKLTNRIEYAIETFYTKDIHSAILDGMRRSKSRKRLTINRALACFIVGSLLAKRRTDA